MPTARAAARRTGFARYCTDLGRRGNLRGGRPFGRGVGGRGTRVESMARGTAPAAARETWSHHETIRSLARAPRRSRSAQSLQDTPMALDAVRDAQSDLTRLFRSGRRDNPEHGETTSSGTRARSDAAYRRINEAAIIRPPSPASPHFRLLSSSSHRSSAASNSSSICA